MQLLKKAMKNLRKYRDIKLVTTEIINIYLVLEPNYYTKKFFTETFLATEIGKIKYS